MWEESLPASNRNQNRVSDIMEDRFIVHMPSAREPQPYIFPGHSSAQIAAYQHYAEKTRKISGGAPQKATVSSTISLSPDHRIKGADCIATHKTRSGDGNGKPMPGTLRIGSPPSSPPHRSAPMFGGFPMGTIATGPSSAPAPVNPDTSIPRKPIACSSAPSKATPSFTPPREHQGHSPSSLASLPSQFTAPPMRTASSSSPLRPSPTPPLTAPTSHRRPSDPAREVAPTRPVTGFSTLPYPTSPDRRTGISHQFNNAVSDLRRLPKIHLVHPGMAGVPADSRYSGKRIRTVGHRMEEEEVEEEQEGGQPAGLSTEEGDIARRLYSIESSTTTLPPLRPALSTLLALLETLHILTTSILASLETPRPQQIDTTHFTSTSPLKSLLINAAYGGLCIYIAISAWHVLLGLKYVFDTILLPVTLLVAVGTRLLG